MMIDPETVRNLELISNQTRKKSVHSLFGYVASLFHCSWLICSRVLNHTYTTMATRLLRANILAPLTGTCTLYRTIVLLYIDTF